MKCNSTEIIYQANMLCMFYAFEIWNFCSTFFFLVLSPFYSCWKNIQECYFSNVLLQDEAREALIMAQWFELVGRNFNFISLHNIYVSCESKISWYFFIQPKPPWNLVTQNNLVKRFRRGSTSCSDGIRKILMGSRRSESYRKISGFRTLLFISC